MTDLKHYLQDGASPETRATLMLIQENANIQESWNAKLQQYDAKIKVSRWENGREQGYILSLRDRQQKQLNIIIFQHRNSGELSATKWEQQSLNALNIMNAVFDNEINHYVDDGEFIEMAYWVMKQFKEHWRQGQQ